MTPCVSVTQVPNKPATKGRTFRIPDDLWMRLVRRAADESSTVTAVVLRALRRYLDES